MRNKDEGSSSSKSSIEDKMALSDYSDDELQAQNKVAIRNATRRFGHSVNLERCQGNVLLRLVAMALFCIFLPLQLLLAGSLRQIENKNLIVPLQQQLPDSCQLGYCNELLSIPIYMSS